MENDRFDLRHGLADHWVQAAVLSSEVLCFGASRLRIVEYERVC
jgi:hypothetical protein